MYIRSPLIRAVGLKKAGRCEPAVIEGKKGSEKVRKGFGKLVVNA